MFYYWKSLLFHNPQFKLTMNFRLFVISSVFIICLIFSLGISAQKKINLTFSDIPLYQAIDLMEKNSTYTFFYDVKRIDLEQNVSLFANNIAIEKAMSQMFEKTAVSYEIINNQIALYPTSTILANKRRTITGVVSDISTGEVLPGVTIFIKNTIIATSSDYNGSYTLVVPVDSITSNSNIVFSSLGYANLSLPIGSSKSINGRMQAVSNDLEEVVVVAYGSQKKETMVGAIHSIHTTELIGSSSHISTGLAGRLAGLVAVQRSGMPGEEGADFWIRGISTFNNMTKPLIILDGVQIDNEELNVIDPESIESFSILKDATATALFGMLGANGVMIVKTKTGKRRDKPEINFRLETTLNRPTYKPKTTDGLTFMQMYNQAAQNSSLGSVKMYSQEKIDHTQRGINSILYPDVDWYSELFKNHTFNEKIHLNIRGGSSRVTYFVSGNANHDRGMTRNRSKDFFSYDNSINLWRLNFQSNIEATLSNTTKVGLRINTQMHDYTGPSRNTGELFNLIIQSNPVDFPVYFDSQDNRNVSTIETNGKLWGGKSSSFDNYYYNPLGEMTKGYNNTFKSSATANLDINQDLDFLLRGLSVKTLFSFRNKMQSSVIRESRYNQYYISEYVLDDNQILSTYKLNFAKDEKDFVLNNFSKVNTGNRTIYIQGLINYDRAFDQHNVAGMFVYNQEQYNENTPYDLITSLPKRKQGVAFRANYNYDYRYLFEFNFGYNGSDNFAKGHRFGFFPSVALGYNIGHENYWKTLKPYINHLKIRGSWGKVGNDQIANERYLYMEKIDMGGVDYTTGVLQNNHQTGPKYLNFGNNNISWEVGEKINIGLDMHLYNTVNFTVDVFSETRSKIFMDRRSVPTFWGTNNIKLYGNIGKVKNQGLDFSVDYNNAIGRDLFISFKGTFTYAHNTILERDEPPFQLYSNQSSIGHSVHTLPMYLASGLFIDEIDVKNSPYHSLGGTTNAGDIKYLDQANIYGQTDGIIDNNDIVYTGQPTVPEIVYGLGSYAKWKQWDFSFFLQGVAKTSLMMEGFHPFGSDNHQNVLQFIADDYWSVENPNPLARYPRLSAIDNRNNTVNSTFWLRDASFLKLKNIELGYTYKWMRIYFRGTNLFTISKFKHWDPEQGGGSGFSYPTQQEYTIGLHLNF